MAWFAKEVHNPTAQYIRRQDKIIPILTDPGHVDVVFERAQGSRIFDIDGGEYIDFSAAVATCAVGHGDPRIREAQFKQHERLDMVEGSTFKYCFKITVDGEVFEISPAALGETLLPLIFPNQPLNDVRLLFDTTGSIAVNVGMLLGLKARRDRKQFIAFLRAFHGRQLTARDLTYSKPIQREDYTSAVGVEHIHFPSSPENFRLAMERLNYIPLSCVNTFWAEFLQGEGGYVWPRIDLMNQLQATIRSKEIFSGFDEIQSGLGRTGKWFAFQHGNIEPDIVTIGKALGGGDVPISAIAYQRKIFDFKDDEILKPGWYSGTFPAYPKGVASAVMFLHIMKKEKLLERVELLSKLLDNVLSKYARPYGDQGYCLKTGFGLMRGLEFKHHDGTPAPAWRDKALRKLMNAKPVGIFTLPAGMDNFNPVIRLAPCFTAPEEDFEILDFALSKSITEDPKK